MKHLRLFVLKIVFITGVFLPSLNEVKAHFVEFVPHHHTCQLPTEKYSKPKLSLPFYTLQIDYKKSFSRVESQCIRIPILDLVLQLIIFILPLIFFLLHWRSPWVWWFAIPFLISAFFWIAIEFKMGLNPYERIEIFNSYTRPLPYRGLDWEVSSD